MESWELGVLAPVPAIVSASAAVTVVCSEGAANASLIPRFMGANAGVSHCALSGSGAGVSPGDGSETAIGLSTGALGLVALAGLLSIIAICGLEAVIVAVPLLPSVSCQ